MLKMFTTQLTGLFKRIHDKEEFVFEDGARLIAQAAISDGTIYMFGSKEMESVVLEATVGVEPLRFAKRFPGTVDSLDFEIKGSDRAIIISRFSTDEDAIQYGRWLHELNVPFIAISTKVESDQEDLFDIADVSLNLHLTKGLLPDEVGNRFGFPSTMAALFAYYGLKFTFDEILAEYDEEI
jgi:hypothetical protein